MVSRIYQRVLASLRRWRFTALAVTALFPLANKDFAQTAATPDQLSGTLRVVGTDTMKELMDRWITAFTATHPGVRFDVSAKGALTAAPALAGGNADLVPLGRELTPAELSLFRKTHGFDPTGIRVALGSYDSPGRTVALAFFVNQNNPITRLNFQQLADIYCVPWTTKNAGLPITWGQLGLKGEWAGVSIHPIGVNFPDGISNFIRLRLCPDLELKPSIRTEHTGGAVNVLQRIVGDVAADPAAIGYAGFGNQQPGTKLVSISEDGNHYLAGAPEDVAGAEYPLTRFIYIYVDRTTTRMSQLQTAFLRFVLSPAGQALVSSDGIYMSLPPALAERERTTVEPSTKVVWTASESQKTAAPHPATSVTSVDAASPHFVPARQMAGQIQAVAAETMDGLMKLWIADFHTRQPRIAIEMNSSASMTVPASLTSGAARVAALSRELNPAEVDAFRARHGYPPTEIAVALGSYNTPTHTVALTFYVNDANPLRRLTLQQLDAMWCTTLRRGLATQITRWGQLGIKGQWEDAPIHLVGVVPPDGVPNFIERRVCAGGETRASVLGEKNGGASSVLTRIVEDVAKDPYAIGYAGFHNRQPGTHAVQISESPGGPYFTGTLDEVRRAVYPLTRFVYVYVDLPPTATAEDRSILQFVNYILSFEGQQQVTLDGTFMPLPASIVSQQRALLHNPQ